MALERRLAIEKRHIQHWRPQNKGMKWGLTRNIIVLCSAVTASSWPFVSCYGQDFTDLGGALSTDLVGRHAIQASAPNVTDETRIQAQAAGFPVFHRTTTTGDGLGPGFINNSCAGCHVNNGKGPASFGSRGRGGSSMVIKVKSRGLLGDRSAPPVPRLGEQILDQRVGDPIKPTVRVSWEELPGRYPDGTTYSLRQPRISLPVNLKPPRGTTVSLRMSPALIGMGLLEAIASADILALSDPRDRDSDGISGKVNWVTDRISGGRSIGRFGFKATHPSVMQQSASALYHDMQISNGVFPEKGRPKEATLDQLYSLAIYLRLAGVPKARGQGDTEAKKGYTYFAKIGCDQCHKPTFVTGVHTDPELSNQTIHPFTDMLLHDMGASLADGWVEFSGNGREWRTTPLWGLGFANQLAKGKALYLHDGRARSVEEAILWHGGEAAASRDAFRKLPRRNRLALLDFLESL